MGETTAATVPTADTSAAAALLEHATESIFLLNESAEIVERIGPPLGPLGYGPDDPDGNRHPAEHVHPDDLITVLEAVGRVRANPGSTETLRVRARHRDGSWRVIEGTVTHAGDDPRLNGAVLRIRDVTPYVSAPNDQSFLSLAEAVPSGILSADALGWVVFANEAAERILDLPADALRGRGWEAVVHPEDLPDVFAASGAVLAASAGEQVTFRARTAPGLRWVHARFVPLQAGSPRSGGHQGAGWIASLDDVTERRRTESQLAHRATHDPLTGLPNRTLLDDRLEQAFARRRRDRTQVAVLFIDLDGFKHVNDRHGHPVGDSLLQEVARRIRSVLRAGDTAARVGGDEFVAVCENTDLAQAAEVAARVEEAISAPVIVDGCRCRVGASIGIAGDGGHDIDPTDLVLQADQDMYRRKLARRSAGG